MKKKTPKKPASCVTGQTIHQREDFCFNLTELSAILFPLQHKRLYFIMPSLGIFWNKAKIIGDSGLRMLKDVVFSTL